jgi:hypothetical protein
VALNFRRFFGNTVGEGAAFAIGAATAPALRPILQDLTNETWSLHPVRPPDAGTLANGVAQGQVDPGDAAVWAAQQGVGAEAFKALVDIANTGPGVPAAFDLWRRGVIDEQGFRRAVLRQGIEPEWIEDFTHLKFEKLDPAVIANAIQQGFLPGAGILPPEGSEALPITPPTEEVDIDPLAEAAAQGYDEDHLRVLAQLSGNPPGPMQLLDLWNRGIITEEAVERGIREGRTKTKWTPALKHLRRPILSGVQYAGLWLRNWISEADAKEGGALSGFTPAQMDLLYKLQGRPPAPGQMYSMWAREAPGPFGGTFDFEDFSDGIRRSNIRTEYVEPLWAIRFNYPSLFQMRQLVSSGALDRTTALDILHKQRYPDDLSVKMVDAWLRGSGATAKRLTAAQLDAEYQGLYITRDEYVTSLEGLGYTADEAQMYAHLGDAKRVAKARDAVIKKIHDSYVGHAIQRAEAETFLAAEELPADAISLLLNEWDHEAAVTRKHLTASQIARAYRRSVLTQAEAVAELADLGYSEADALTYLASTEPAPPQAPPA